MISFDIPVKTISEANRRDHWAVKMKRAKLQRMTAKVSTLIAIRRFPGCKVRLPTVITLTRIGKRRTDSDNLAGSAKAVRDGIADAIGIDDGDERLDWQYRQEIGKTYSVRVEIL